MLKVSCIWEISSEPMRIQEPFLEELSGILEIRSSPLILLGNGYRVFCLTSLQQNMDLEPRESDRAKIFAMLSFPWVLRDVMSIRFLILEGLFVLKRLELGCAVVLWELLGYVGIELEMLLDRLGEGLFNESGILF